MRKKLHLPISVLIIAAAVFWQFYGSMPQNIEADPSASTEFSTRSAFEHVKVLGQQPHYVGSKTHSFARNYILTQLQELGLQAEVQEGYSLSKEGILTKPQNILARIEGSGTGKALVLMTHYDSAVHSSPGASDAASGVGTILEGIRAYQASGTVPVNDIIIVFTDAEELGLNGALLFVKEHPWAQEVGLALNFEARGSGGNSFMLLETNNGNKSLIDHFISANPEFPVTNSLAYSVYKMLPNDTDLTVLREENGINGFNFAFIDDHFDYHTANDTPENLDLNTLAHQGSYLMPLLKHFSEVPLENLDSEEDVIYFNFPIFDIIQYPFSWIWPMLILAALFFLGLVSYGILKKDLDPRLVLKGFAPLLLSLIAAGGLSYLFWKLCLYLYPRYQEMEHGFTYNGYYYIAAVILLSVSICFYIYNRFRTENQRGEFLIAPLFMWLLICTLAAAFLEGAAYFVLLVYFGLLQLFLLIRQKNPNLLLLTFLSLPAIFILMPFISSFPVALGLGILFVAAILTVFLWTFIWPVFKYYNRFQLLRFLSLLGFLVLVILAHFKSDFSAERPKPNSLVYLLDSDINSATWNTYDGLEDEWTDRYFGESSVEAEGESFSSKYNSGFTKTSKAPVILLREPQVSINRISADSLGRQWFELRILPRRQINRMEIYTDSIINFPDFYVNGLAADPVSSEEGASHIFSNRWNRRLLTYFAADGDALELKFSVQGERLPEFILYEASHDLLKNDQLDVPARAEDMIPRPFVLNDAIVIKKSFNLEQ